MFEERYPEDSVYVRGEGNPDARLMIVGEAPAYYETIEGGPFKGPAGRLLNKFLSEAGVSRNQCYLTNLVKVRAPGDKFARLREIGVHPQEHMDELRQEIQETRPNCILALGANPLKYLCGRSGKGNSITQNRGSILPLLPSFEYECKVVPTYHPSGLLSMRGSEVTDYRDRLWVVNDIKRAAEESLYSGFDLPVRHVTIARNSSDVWRYVQRFRGRKAVAADIETKWSIPILLALAFCPEEAISIPLLDFDSPYHSGRLCVNARDVAQSLKIVYDLLSNPNLFVYGQNFKYDHDKLALRGCNIRGRIVDILLLHHALYPEFPKDLGFLTSLYTREPYYKIEGREFVFGKDRLENYAIYNGKDACVTFEIAEILLKELEEAGLTEFYFGYPEGNWRNPFCVEKLHHLYMHIDNVGFAFDQEINKGLKIKYKLWREQVQQELDELVGGHVNVKSFPQVNYLLYEHLKLPKRAGASEDVLVKLRNSPAVRNDEAKRVIDLILEIRRLRDVESRYLAAKTDFDDRMRTVFNIGGTVTGRTSTQVQRPPVRPQQSGLAFHTITKYGEIGPDIRKQLRTDPGYVLVQADGAQAEARVVFLFARNYERLARMDDPDYDIHAETASWFNPGMTIAELKKDKLRRFTGKKMRHAGHYDMEKGRCAVEFNNDAKRFGFDIQISEWKAGKNLEIFHAKDPSIKEVFHQEVRDIIDTTKCLVSPHGRRREFYGDPDDHQFYKEAYSQLPQATVSDNTKKAMLAIRDRDPYLRIVLEWHDGFVALVPEKEIESYGYMFIEEMERPIDFSECSLSRPPLVIPCELEISETSFYDLKPLKLPKAA